MLYLGANPHIQDVYGQRPSDICQLDGLKQLLEMKLNQTVKPQVSDSFENSSKDLKLGGTSHLGSSKLGSTLISKEEKMYPLEVKDVEQIPAEKLVAARIGSNSDTYLHHAINNMRQDLLVYLLKEVPGIDFDCRNSQG